MDYWPVLFPFLLFAFFLIFALAHQVKLSKQRNFIRHHRLPPALFDKLRTQYPQLQRGDMLLVAQGLRDLFLAYQMSGKKAVAMPSRVVDELWHEFILDTREYGKFCEQAFGQYFHHIPSAVMGRNKEQNTTLRRTWWYTCKEANIDPRKPSRLPLLFALDRKLGIAGATIYTLSEMNALTKSSGDRDGMSSDSGGAVVSVSVFSDQSVDGSLDGFGDSGSGGDGGSCGGGCGGD